MPKTFGLRELRAGLYVILKNGLLQRKLFITTMILTVVYAIINPIDTYLIGRFIDYVTKPTLFHIPWTAEVIPLYSAILVALFIVLLAEFVLSHYRVLASLKLNELARTTYITTFINHLFKIPVSFHKSVKIGEVQEKLTTASTALGGILGDDISAIVPQFISSIIFLIILFVLNHTAFIIVLVALVIYIYASVSIIRPSIPLQRQSHAAYAKVRGIAMDSVINIKIIKDFVAEERQTEAIRSGYQDTAMSIWYRMIGFRRRQIFSQNIIVMFARISIFTLSVYLVHDAVWSIGDLVIANAYLTQIFNPIAALSNNWRNIQNGMIALEETEAILAKPIEIYEPTGSEKTLSIGTIEFKGVSFGYSPEQLVLNDISFEAKQGQLIALVGESGVGKSTLVELLSGYYFPQQGSITINGNDIKSLSLKALRQSIGVVTQEITLFNDTIKNNLKFGNFNVTDEEIYTAARRAHCDFIERFPEKWNQVVGERGLKLSVGQKQRIAIARAILKNPQILILDEPTSALDAGSEKIITESLDELMKGKTTFVVAHRLSTVRRADTILVFKQGKIIESGTHQELIKKEDGEYRRLHELQIGLHD
ncbi:MAG: ABC transporter ATP-binding protein [Candidatus Taylorbacteria bacterium]